MSDINLDFAFIKPTSTSANFIPAGEIFEFTDTENKVFKLRKIINLPPDFWQVFNFETKRWELIKYNTILNYWKANFINDRKVIFEKFK